MDINDILKKYNGLIKHYAKKYCSYPNQIKDFEQELRIKLWRALTDKYDPALGFEATFIKHTLILWARRLKYDESVQSKFDNSFFYKTFLLDLTQLYYAPYEEINFKKWLGFINKHLTFEERRILNILIAYCRANKPIVFNRIAKDLGINRFILYKNLSRIRKKITTHLPF